MVRFLYIFCMIYVTNIYAVTCSSTDLINFTDNVTNIDNNESKIVLNNQSISIYFDFILDEDITKSDPRIKSIIYTALTLKNSTIFIEFSNFNSIFLAEKIAKILKSESLIISEPKIRGSLSFCENEISKLVKVYIVYADER